MLWQGDFVDRGYNSLEVFTILLLLKARYVLVSVLVMPLFHVAAALIYHYVIQCIPFFLPKQLLSFYNKKKFGPIRLGQIITRPPKAIWEFVISIFVNFAT
jgi:hypothetical protein